MFTRKRTKHILSSGSLPNRWFSESLSLYPVIPFILILLIAMPMRNLAHYKFEDEIPINISISSHWDCQEDNFRNIGSYSLQFSGKAKLAEEKDEKDEESLRYVSKDIKATYKLEGKSIMMNPDDKCFGKIFSMMSAHGAIAITPEIPEISESEWGSFILDISLGETGKWAKNQQELTFFGKTWEPDKEPLIPFIWPIGVDRRPNPKS